MTFRRIALRSAGIVVSIALVAAACGSSTPPGAEIAPQDPILVATGADLYRASCASCHGVDMRGTDEGPSLLSEIYEPGHHADISFLFAVQRGVQAHHWSFGDMEPIEGLSEQEVAAIVAFVRDAQLREGFESYPP